MGATAFCRFSTSRRAEARAPLAVSPASRSAPVELLVGPAEFAPAGLVERRLPGLGDLAGPAEGRAADLRAGQLLDPLGHPAGLAGVEVGPDLHGHPLGQGQAGRRQGVGRGVEPFGDPEVVDGAGQVVGLAPARGPGDQLHRHLVPELDGEVVVGHLGPGGEPQGLVQAAGPGRLVRLPQCDPPLSQHG